MTQKTRPELQAVNSEPKSNTPHGISKPIKQQHQANYMETIKSHMTPTTSNTMSDTKTKPKLKAANNGPKSNTPHGISKPTKQQNKPQNTPKQLNPTEHQQRTSNTMNDTNKNWNFRQ
jgi:hypothetical protein